MSIDGSGLTIDESRFATERIAMEQQIPEASLIRFDSEQYPLAWAVCLSVDETEYGVLVAYHSRFPADPPAVFIAEPQLDPTRTEHMYADGRLSFRSSVYDWDKTSTAVTGVLLADDWLRMYEGVHTECTTSEAENRSELRSTDAIKTSEFTRV